MIPEEWGLALKAINTQQAIISGVLYCAAVLFAGLALPEKMASLFPSGWLITLPAPALILRKIRAEAEHPKPTLWGWWNGLVYIPAALILWISLIWSDALPWPALPDPLIVFLIFFTTAWPAILIILLYLLKWTISARMPISASPGAATEICG